MSLESRVSSRESGAFRYALDGPGGAIEVWVEPLGDGRLRVGVGGPAAGTPAAGTPVEVRPGPGGGALVPVEVGGRRRLVGFARLADGRYQIVWDGVAHVVRLGEPGAAAAAGGIASAAGGAVSAPIPGMVVKVHVAPGARVAAGAPLVVLYAMKVENDIRAPAAGTVAEVRAREGQPVEKGDLLVRIEAPA